MDKKVSPSKISGTVKAPASKSFMQRAIALSVLVEGETIIENPSRCDDALAGMNIATSFGCKVYDNGEFISIVPDKKIVPNKLFCGESGLAIRLFTPIAGLYPNTLTLEAEGSLLKRPADFMTSTMQQLGVKVETANGFPPLKVTGPLQPGIAELDGSLSSQFLSGLLITLPVANGDSHLKVNNLMSIPYIDMTLKAIESFGGKVINKDYKEFIIKGNQQYNAGKYLIEGDWSGAAGLLVAGAIAGDITITSLQINSSQADIAIVDAVKQTGATVKTIDENTISVIQPENLQPFDIDATHCPDLFPVLASLAVNCEGISKIKGVHRLTHKESNRGEAIKDEFSKLGAKIWFEGDTMLIEGGKLHGAEVFAHNDHRIAMALTLATLNSDGDVLIKGAECVNKTYPEFYDDMESLGVKIA